LPVRHAVVPPRIDCCVSANALREIQDFACEQGPPLINIRTSFHTPRAKATPMNLRPADMQTLRSTTVDGVLRMRFEILGRFSGIRLAAGTLR
jgi:hypothetical protein